MKTENSASARVVNKFKKLAQVVIRHHFGTSAPRIAFKASGLTNFVFAVKHAEGDFIVRISPDAGRINSFIKEQWAETAARKAGVPAPEILEVGSEAIPHPYMISRTVSGGDATHHPQRLEILREMGRYAALINSIQTNGFGQTFDWSSNQLSRNETFKEYLQKEYCFEKKLKILEKNRAVSSLQIKKLRKIFTEAMRMTPKPALNHGDIRLKNVIVGKNGKINAIIDWEGCTSNIAPQWELSLALHDHGIDGMQHFLKGYGINHVKFKEIAPLIKAFNITNYAAAIEGIADAKDSERLEQYRTRLSGAFDLYSL
ncbi:MAG: phosphotransferase family protein [Pyrinomonadaceae bacterium]|nr:aminoglycoside phosphotransferase family protein [Blastocatellia bacterium]MDQ3220496.1 aminoglycoside phosphotransferase family protein [Acidobacteriota bacterium]